MKVLLRLVVLVVYAGGGDLIGSMIGRLLLIPIFAVARVDNTFRCLLVIASGLGWFKAKFPLDAAGAAFTARPIPPTSARCRPVLAAALA